MGSIPTQKIEIDLDDDTSALIDVTAYVKFDRGSAVRYSHGRSSPWQAEPRPGSMSFTLENLTGRFTPGSTAIYYRGIRPGVLVRWTCGARVLDFDINDAELSFPDGVASTSQVEVQCLDALGSMGRSMASMLAEHILAHDPVAYYPFTERAPDRAEGVLTVAQSARAKDLSRFGGQDLRPPRFDPATSAEGLGWTKATGPPTDGAGSLLVNGDEVTPGYVMGQTASLVTDFEGTARSLPSFATGPNSPQHLAMAWSAWVTVKDIYGPTGGTPGLTTGPFVLLGRFNGSTGTPVQVLWRIADRRIVLHWGAPGVLGGFYTLMSSSAYSVSPTDLHSLVIVIRAAPTTPWTVTVQGFVDGIARSSVSTSWAAAGASAGFDPPFNTGGIEVNNGSSGAETVYPLVGGVSHVSMHGPLGGVQITSATASVPAVFPGFAVDGQAIGVTGLPELADTRAARIASYARRLDVTFATVGTPLDAQLGIQDTAGKSVLAGLCVALAGEGSADLSLRTVAGVNTLTATLGSAQRSRTPVVVVDADADGSGSPTLAFDTSGAATTVEVRGADDLTVSFLDAPALASWPAKRVAIDAALQYQGDLLLLAQYRATLGRTAVVAPTLVTVNAANSKANITANLLQIIGGSTVQLTGLPSGVIGYASALAIVLGVTESHSTAGSVFRMALRPFGPEDYLDDPDDRFEPISGFGTAYIVTTVGGVPSYPSISSSQTSMDVLSLIVLGSQFLAFSTDAADYPMYVRLDAEVIQLTVAPSAAVTAGGGYMRQTLTGVVRAALGTTATTHSSASFRGLADTDGLDPYLGY